MYSVRAGFDSYIYWGVFIFVAAFMGYFLVSLMSLASAEEEENIRAAMYGYIPRSYMDTATSSLAEDGH